MTRYEMWRTSRNSLDDVNQFPGRSTLGLNGLSQHLFIVLTTTCVQECVCRVVCGCVWLGNTRITSMYDDKNALRRFNYRQVVDWSIYSKEADDAVLLDNLIFNSGLNVFVSQMCLCFFFVSMWWISCEGLEYGEQRGRRDWQRFFLPSNLMSTNNKTRRRSY